MEIGQRTPEDPAPLALTSPALERAGFRHGFFLRNGGSSPDPFRSLNFALNGGDTAENVSKNREVAARFLGVDAARIYYLSQVHGTSVEFLRGDEDAGAVVHWEGDAIISKNPQAACCVRSADCGTLLIGDPDSGAACAVHAGWRGTVAGIVFSAIQALTAAMRAQASRLVVAIGPHIEACCFEVGDDVAAEIAACSAAGEGVVRRREGGKRHVDLRAVLVAQLVAAGVDEASIDHVRGCTLCEPERFFSYRREGKVSGRLLSAIVPRA